MRKFIVTLERLTLYSIEIMAEDESAAKTIAETMHTEENNPFLTQLSEMWLINEASDLGECKL